MSDRALSLGGALLALVVVLGLLGPGPRFDEKPSQPTSADTGPRGFAAVARWLQHGVVDAGSWQRRYSALADGVPGDGHLLITRLPHRLPVRRKELADLAAWVESGNKIVVLVDNLDAATRDFAAAFGLRLTHEPRKGGAQDFAALLDEAAVETRAETAVPTGPHPLLDGVETVTVEQRVGSALNVLPEHEARLVVPLLATADDDRPRLWLARHGAGRVVVLAGSRTFSNRAVLEADNAGLFDNLVGFARDESGRVLFDDMHQGISALYDARAFAADPRTRATAWILFGLWLLWIIGHGNRFGPVRTRPAIEDGVGYARTIGGLFAREAEPRGLARALVRQFERYCRRRHPMWFESATIEDVLASHPAMPDEAVGAYVEAKRLLADDRDRAPALLPLAIQLQTLKERL